MQVAAAHCPNERTLDPHVPQSATIKDPPVPQPATLWPSPHNVLWQQLTIFSSECYQILIATHLPTAEGWKTELACSGLITLEHRVISLLLALWSATPHMDSLDLP